MLYDTYTHETYIKDSIIIITDFNIGKINFFINIDSIKCIKIITKNNNNYNNIKNNTKNKIIVLKNENIIDNDEIFELFEEYIIKNDITSYYNDIYYNKNNDRLYDKNNKYIIEQENYDSLYNKNILSNNFSNSGITIKIDNIFIINGSHTYHVHYIENFPMIILYKLYLKKNKFLKIKCLNKYLKQYQELEIIFNVPITENILCYGDYHIENCITSLTLPKIYMNYGNNKNVFPLTILFSLMIKNYFYILRDNETTNNKYSYIGRKYNNILNDGNNRTIINIDEFKNYLYNKNIIFKECDDLTFNEKYNFISNSKIIIVEAGSGLVNLYFCYIPINVRIIIVTNEIHLNCHGIFKPQLKTIINKEVDVFSCRINDLKMDIKNMNNPYCVDINEFDNFINQYLKS
jgi:hypothetical protein